MLIGPRGEAKTSLCTSDATSVTVRGMDLCSELIGHVSFTDYFIFLLTGEKPTDVQRRCVDAMLVSLAEHGLTPSVQATRMTLAAGPDAWQGAVAAGILGVGSVILGSSETAGRLFARGLQETKETGDSMLDVARRLVRSLRERKQPLPGFGHNLHKPEDPRAVRLLQFADELGASGDHIRFLRALGQAADEIYGRHLPANVTAVIAALLLDLGFPVDALKAIPILGRTASLLAHMHEETTRPIGFLLAHAGEEAIAYDGGRVGAAEPT